MVVSKRLILVATVLALAGCSTSQDPNANDDYYAEEFSLTSPTAEVTPPVSNKETPPTQKSPEQPRVSESKPVASATPAEIRAKYAKSGSFIGQKVQTIGQELRQLQEKIKVNSDSLRVLRDKGANESRKYYEYIAHINARLQIGTTPGNPELTEMWAQAATQVDQLDQNITAMALLATQVSKDSAMITYLLDAVRATFAVSGALDAEHEQLRVIEDQTNQSAVLLERLVSEITTQVARQQQYVVNERRNIATLDLGIRIGQLFGVNLADPTTIPTDSVAPTIAAISSLPKAQINGRRPLMVIRFDRRKVAFEQPLYQAIKTALEKRPQTSFELVAVSPAGLASGNYEAIKNTELVRTSLSSMGLPPNRVSMSKMQSTTAKTTEVHLYLK